MTVPRNMNLILCISKRIKLADLMLATINHNLGYTLNYGSLVFFGLYSDKVGSLTKIDT
jgi:hypothetical protein